jgi:phosphohistidine phosphatase SixA
MKLCVALLGVLALVSGSYGQTLTGKDLVKALRQGGYVIVMRHASSPREAPARETANPDNLSAERQLDDQGKLSAEAFGKALRRLKIPIGEVLSSPTYRAIQTVQLAGLRNPRPEAELGDNGQSMQGITEGQAAWMRKRVTQFPTGTNTLLITHLPNISKAFPDLSPTPEDGEALVFGPNGIVARIRIEEWPKMRG